MTNIHSSNAIISSIIHQSLSVSFHKHFSASILDLMLCGKLLDYYTSPYRRLSCQLI